MNEVVKIGALEFKQKKMEVVTRQGNGPWIMMAVKAKDGSWRRYICKGVEKFTGEDGGGFEE